MDIMTGAAAFFPPSRLVSQIGGRITAIPVRGRSRNTSRRPDGGSGPTSIHSSFRMCLGDVAGAEHEAGQPGLTERDRASVPNGDPSHLLGRRPPTRSIAALNAGFEPGTSPASVPSGDQRRHDRPTAAGIRSGLANRAMLAATAQTDTLAGTVRGFRRGSSGGRSRPRRRSGTTLTLTPPSIRPTDRLGGPRIGSGVESRASSRHGRPEHPTTRRHPVDGVVAQVRRR